MTPEGLFTVSGFIAMAGWAVLAAGILFNQALLRDVIAGRLIPALLALAYAVLILLHWIGASGGFGSLADVAQLFANPWLLLAGWMHYLAFDLAIGAVMARKVFDEGLPRLILVPVLPLTFLFGPIGWLVFEILRLIVPKLRRKAIA